MNKEKLLNRLLQQKRNGMYCEIWEPINTEWLYKAIENGDFDNE
ncbi:hypothetical protein [Spiroplasma endosymbiont of Amphimallon solstitiale]